MKIAITGATGFIGRYMLRGMIAAGHDVRALVRPGREDALERPVGPNDCTVEVHVGDLTDPPSIEGFLCGLRRRLAEEWPRA